jgi:hypothetical protein
LVTATPEGGETYAEVAHEAIFRRWDNLRKWIATEREFLAWRTGLEAVRRAWQATPENSKNDALLTGVALTQAVSPGRFDTGPVAFSWFGRKSSTVQLICRVRPAQKGARRSRLRILPAADIGSGSSRISTLRGHL